MVVPDPICVAARIGDVAVLREYFAAGDRDPNDTRLNGWSTDGQTLLDYAGEARHFVSDVECRDYQDARWLSCLLCA